ncbi:MAG TPA: hypothetical protein PLP33_14480 [Leptospiraceae bacterium]|nr:hypothetical protein [Leptospiraceae bacterium]
MDITTEKIINLSEWDRLVHKVYKRPYSFQQQDGCKERGLVDLTVPQEFDESGLPETIPEIVNTPEMCVKFSAWLERNPNKPLNGEKNCRDFSVQIWWERNFYPDVQMVANDLHAKGLLEAGKYYINIDW